MDSKQKKKIIEPAKWKLISINQILLLFKRNHHLFFTDMDSIFFLFEIAVGGNNFFLLLLLRIYPLRRLTFTSMLISNWLPYSYIIIDLWKKSEEIFFIYLFFHPIFVFLFSILGFGTLNKFSSFFLDHWFSRDVLNIIT